MGEQYEKEERERKLREKEQKEKEGKERKLKEKQEKEQRDKDEKEKKLRLPSDFIKPQPSSIAGKTPDSSQFGTAQASVFQHDQAFETQQVRVTTPVQVQQDFSTALSHHDEQPSQSHEIHDQSFPETDEFDQFFKATGPSFSQFSDNLNQQYSDDFNQQYSDNFNPMPVMEEPPMFVEDYGPPLTEKERKKKEKELKKEREKEEKERKKRE